MVTKLNEYELYQEILKDREKQQRNKENRDFYEAEEIVNYAQYIISYITNYVLSLPPTIETKDKSLNNRIDKIFSSNDFYGELIKSLKTLLIEGKAYFLIYESTDGLKIEKQNRYNKVIFIKNAQNRKKTDLIIRYGYFTDVYMRRETLWVEQYYKAGNRVYRETYLQDLNGSLKRDNEELLTFKDFPIIELDLGTTYLSRIKPACEKINSIVRGYASVLEKLRLYIIKVQNSGIVEGSINALTNEEREAFRMEKAMQEKALARKLDNNDISTIFIDDRISPTGLLQEADVNVLELPDKSQSLREGLRDLEQKLFLVAQVPNLRDENFSGNSSGVALKFKTKGSEQLKNEIIRELTKGIKQILKVIEPAVESTEWNIIFYPDDVEDFSQNVDNIVKLYDSELIDRESAIEYLKIGNVNKIMANIKKEQAEDLGYSGLTHGDD